MLTWIEIKFWTFVKYIIRKEYGADCRTSDLDDFPETYTKSHDFESDGRCASCKAKEAIDWIDGHIKLMRF